ncbi:phenylalanine--tRNA ligase subunit alpha [Candidatus Sumerlaeota bacterium]|nr:phenylalanine--tRNA ligase subunit alpha [Candidatus Sumerlaeota bacterium]
MTTSIAELKSQLDQIREAALRDIEQAATAEAAQDIHQKYMGKKGAISQILRQLGQLDAKDRPILGAAANEVKAAVVQALQQRQGQVGAAELNQQLEQERLDITLPGEKINAGRLHPLTQVAREIRDIFISMGFEVARGPDIETDFHNFTALNIPPHHPARDMHDTFYLPGQMLLRTHTSPVQIRTMLNQQPPVAIIAPGAVYRVDADVTHSPMFHQIEGLLVSEYISFGDLKGTLEALIHRFFGPEIPLRFRPSFFPFTEPSAEVDMGCPFCKTQGCRICSQSGYIEVMGCGMVHPNVLKNVNYDPEKYCGYAFGLGIERFAMIKYQINDIRLFYDNDIRFLQQF